MRPHPIKHQNPATSPCGKTDKGEREREREESYIYIGRYPPPGDPIQSFDINDLAPEADVEIRAVVAGMRNGRASNIRGVKTKHLKLWLQGIQEEERVKLPKRKKERKGGITCRLTDVTDVMGSNKIQMHGATEANPICPPQLQASCRHPAGKVPCP